MVNFTCTCADAFGYNWNFMHYLQIIEKFQDEEGRIQATDKTCVSHFPRLYFRMIKLTKGDFRITFEQ